jgi:glycine dehydrogenase subunit 2
MAAGGPPGLPELSELDVVRHFTRLSHLNYGVDSGFYPLGSCTMKYNPKVNEKLCRLESFTEIHPYFSRESMQGALQLMGELERCLCEVTGMDRFTLQPAAGAHGELTALLMAGAYFRSKGESRRKILVPDSAHGTNPASASMAGFSVVEVKSDSRGDVSMEDLRAKTDEETACIMLTNPNTLGLFDSCILKIAEVVHGKGGLLYYDGANLNATLGMVRPADMGFDLIHINLHKTFSTPHGGGGPGSGPVGAVGDLVHFLPVPMVERSESGYYLDFDRPRSIGRVRAFMGNFLVLLRAYVYLRMLGAEGLKEVSETAVLNANYMMEALRKAYHLPYDRTCMHEFVLSAKIQKEKGVRAGDIAKRLLDYGFHAPTTYFPLIVEDALMIEPTETESLQTLDEFIRAMISIAKEVDEDPSIVTGAPTRTPVERLDEVTAARKPVLRYKP